MERPRACGLRRLHPAHRRARVLRAEVRQTSVGGNALAVAETDASEEGRRGTRGGTRRRRNSRSTARGETRG